MKFCLSFLLIIPLLSISGQESWISARLGHGFFVPHRETLPQLLNAHSHNFELSYNQKVNGSKAWHQYWEYPHKGIAFAYVDMGNREELGSIYSLYPYIDLPLGKTPKQRLWLHLGVGFAYVDKKWDFIDNPYNIAIGSHVNYSIVLGTRYQFNFDSWKAELGLNITHASNASIQLPNLGANVASIELGLSYRLKSGVVNEEIYSLSDWISQKKLKLEGSLGFRESNYSTREKHSVQELKMTYSKGFSPKLNYKIGLDFIHNKASYQERVEKIDFGLDVIQSGVNVGLGMEFGNSELFFQNGFYLAQGKQEQGFIYHRVGGSWHFAENCFASLSMKTHFAKADYLALGFGYVLKQK